MTIATAKLCRYCGYDNPPCLCGCNHSRICRECCSHVPCVKCGVCGSSPSCACIKCAACKEPVDSRDVLCEHMYCETCHARCGLMQRHELVFLTPTPKGPHYLLAPHATRTRLLDPRLMRTNKSRRYASVEIEVDSAPRFRKTTNTCRALMCSVVTDGCVRNGYEINTAPACGDPLIAMIETLCDAMHQDGAIITQACGLHVHVDARDFCYQDMQRLVAIYAAVEEALFAACSWWRHDTSNAFARPCGDVYYNEIVNGINPETAKVKHAIIEATYGRGATEAIPSGRYYDGKRERNNPRFMATANQHYGAGHGSARYNALNIHSWYLRGTVEARMRQGTTNAVDISMWTRLWIALVDQAASISPRVLSALLNGRHNHDTEMKDATGILRAAGTRQDLDVFKARSGAFVLRALVPSDVWEWYTQQTQYFTRNRKSQEER